MILFLISASGGPGDSSMDDSSSIMEIAAKLPDGSTFHLGNNIDANIEVEAAYLLDADLMV